MLEVLVIMPYGKRSFLSGGSISSLNFDLIYSELIRPAIEIAGYTSLRIDELSASGDITHQYINKIFAADIVIADLSMPNGNVYYELGIRQSLSNHPTVLIAQTGTELPFDIRNQRVLFYNLSIQGSEGLVHRLIIKAFEGDQLTRVQESYSGLFKTVRPFE